MADVNATVLYYVDLLLFQYNQRPKARETIDLLVRQALCDLLPVDVSAAFDLDTAVGPQLDILGEYIGFSRQVPIQLPQPFFQLDDYTLPLIDPIGFRDYTDETINQNSVFYLYIFQNTSFSTLTDEHYRFMLRLKSLLNVNNNTLASINTAMDLFFDGAVSCFDQLDMSLSYLIQGVPSYLLQIAVDLDLLPRPMAVRISGVFLIPDVSKLFIYADYEFDNGADIGFSDYLTGFNDYHWLDYRDRIA